ncbi:MAG TPA: hypothetical protein VMB72_15595, partial [Acidimicrobiales bacterium]|nr:hypothetical protein [Acidimicrobiales bacterium]
MADVASTAPLGGWGDQPVVAPRPLCIPVGVGRRTLVAANLGLTPRATPATRWASAGLARALDTWEGPGLVAVAGDLLDRSGGGDVAEVAREALAAHPALAGALERFAAGPDRRVVCVPGAGDAALAGEAGPVLEALGIEVAPGAIDLELTTAAGTRRVRVEAGSARPRGLPAPGDGGG